MRGGGAAHRERRLERGDAAKVLCASTSFAAGVMLLLAFTEVMEKSVASWGRGFSRVVSNASASSSAWAGKTLEETNAARAQNAAFTCVFLGVLIVYGLTGVMHCAKLLLGNGGSVDDDDVEHRPIREGGEATKPRATATSTSLLRVGTLMALTIGLHNLPEGLATFVAALDDPKLGATLAVAIALHNMPEGVCVAAPIVLGTGSAKRAMLLATASALAEVVGGLIGLALATSMPASDETFGVLFGLVGGMMVCISVKDLLPESHACDDSHGVASSAFAFAGMAVMAGSIALFRVA